MLRLPRALGSLVLLAGLAVFLIGQGNGCGSGENGEEADVEYKLAVIDLGDFVDPNDPPVEWYAVLLDTLAAKCEEDRSLIADQAVRAIQLLADEGISVTALEALRGMDQSIPAGSPILSCADIAAAWVTLTASQ